MLRLLDHLATLGLKGNAAREALRSGKVKIDGVPVADGGRQVEPTRVRLDVNSPRIVVGRDPAILWFDPYLAVVWKPPHMLSVPAQNRPDADNLLRFVGHRLGRAFPVHRLDEETSGLMMVARTEAAQEALKARLEAHQIERSYLALVRGHFPAGPPREVRTLLVRDRGDGLRGSLPEGAPPFGAKLAVTRLGLVERIGRCSLVEAQLETGRTHQVRIHLAEAGYPVLGDPLYADAGARRLAPRLALHAARLVLTHPFSGAALRFDAPLADDLEILRRRLADTTKNAPKARK